MIVKCRLTSRDQCSIVVMREGSQRGNVVKLTLTDTQAQRVLDAMLACREDALSRASTLNVPASLIADAKRDAALCGAIIGKLTKKEK